MDSRYLFSTLVFSIVCLAAYIRVFMGRRFLNALEREGIKETPMSAKVGPVPFQRTPEFWKGAMPLMVARLLTYVFGIRLHRVSYRFSLDGKNYSGECIVVSERGSELREKHIVVRYLPDRPDANSAFLDLNRGDNGLAPVSEKPAREQTDGSQRAGRSPWPYIITGLLALAGIIACASFTYASIIPGKRVWSHIFVPGQKVLVLEQGSYQLWHKTENVRKTYRATQGEIDGLECTIKNRATGETIELSMSRRENYIWSGRPVFDFEVQNGGLYFMKLEYSGAESGPPAFFWICRRGGWWPFIWSFAMAIIMVAGITVAMSIFFNRKGKR